MKAKALPPVETLRERFTYNPETGEIVYRESRGCRKAGDIAGWTKSDGYCRINIGGASYALHRVCYALHYGVDPYPMELDHINKDKTDNRIDNLRCVTRSENVYNSDCSHNNTSGQRGVYYCKNKKSNQWGVKMGNKFVGYYATKEEAIGARQRVEKEWAT